MSSHLKVVTGLLAVMLLAMTGGLYYYGRPSADEFHILAPTDPSCVSVPPVHPAGPNTTSLVYNAPISAVSLLSGTDISTASEDNIMKFSVKPNTTRAIWHYIGTGDGIRKYVPQGYSSISFYLADQDNIYSEHQTKINPDDIVEWGPTAPDGGGTFDKATASWQSSTYIPEAGDDSPTGLMTGTEEFWIKVKFNHGTSLTTGSSYNPISSAAWQWLGVAIGGGKSKAPFYVAAPWPPAITAAVVAPAVQTKDYPVYKPGDTFQFTTLSTQSGTVTPSVKFGQIVGAPTQQAVANQPLTWTVAPTNDGTWAKSVYSIEFSASITNVCGTGTTPSPATAYYTVDTSMFTPALLKLDVRPEGFYDGKDGKPANVFVKVTAVIDQKISIPMPNMGVILFPVFVDAPDTQVPGFGFQATNGPDTVSITPGIELTTNQYGSAYAKMLINGVTAADLARPIQIKAYLKAAPANIVFGKVTVNLPYSWTPSTPTIATTSPTTPPTAATTTPDAPTIQLTADQTTVDEGQSVRLTWSTANATSVVSSNFDAGTSLQGSKTIKMTDDQTFTMMVAANGVQAIATQKVTVNKIPTKTASKDGKTITITSPKNGTSIKNGKLSLSGTVKPKTGPVTVTINGTAKKATLNKKTGKWTLSATLKAGSHDIISATGDAKARIKVTVPTVKKKQ